MPHQQPSFLPEDNLSLAQGSCAQIKHNRVKEWEETETAVWSAWLIISVFQTIDPLHVSFQILGYGVVHSKPILSF